VKVSEIFAGQQVRVDGADVDVTALAYDSRRVERGSLFAALVGARADGHDHVQPALSAGAVAVLCERAIETGDATRVIARDARLALARAARQFYGDPAARLRMVGVTGTNGKTTTVHLLESILAAAGERPGIIGTLGTRHAGGEEATGLTTPESVDFVALLRRMAEAGTTSVAMEVSSHALAQERVSGASFDAGVFLNLSQDHLDYHGSFDNYFAAKARLFRERLKPGGAAAVNLDDRRVLALAGELQNSRPVFGFSLAASDDVFCKVWLEEARLEPTHIAARIQTDAGQLRIASRLVGSFNVQNILAAVAAARAIGIEPDAIERGIAQLQGVPGRLERVAETNGPLVLVDYAHTPDAIEKALHAVREVTGRRLFCVFGCGGDRDEQKRPQMGAAAARAADWSIVTSDNPRSEDPAAIIEAILPGFEQAGAVRSDEPARGGFAVVVEREEAISRAIGLAAPGDAVLIAGKGHESYQIIGETKRPFDDRERARAALAAAGFSVTPPVGVDRRGE
jgi:UDP-N-acetylmuramoyl-L-alanyl-D-glutamate--2,6-diaminopimelate ligase